MSYQVLNITITVNLILVTHIVRFSLAYFHSILSYAIPSSVSVLVYTFKFVALLCHTKYILSCILSRRVSLESRLIRDHSNARGTRHPYPNPNLDGFREVGFYPYSTQGYDRLDEF